MPTARGDSFDEERLLGSARRVAGSDDFGSEPFLEPLRVLLDSLRSAPLNDLGAMIMRGTLLRSLSQRVRAEEWWTAHPEILAEPIAAPIVIVGMMRSGTTLLQRVLASDPRFACAYGWEVGEPSPRAGWDAAAPDPRIADAEAREEQTRTFATELFAIHPTYVHEAEEEIVFLADAFLSHIPEASCDVPRYRSWLDTQDFAPAYRWLRRMLQLLQWQKRQRGKAPRPFILKTPAHLGYLETLLAEFPDAHIVHTHRDPVDVIPSGASLNTTLWRTHCNTVDPHEVGRQWIERMGWSCDRAVAARARIPAGQVSDVAFVDAVADPIGTAANILAAVGLELTSAAVAAMEAWIAQDAKRETLPVHRYSAADFGLTTEQIQERFADYTARFLQREAAPMQGHPVATTEQHEHEKAALRIWEHPVVAEAREVVRTDWLEKEQPSPVMRDCFDWAFEEVMFSATIWSSNQDPHHPEVTCITRLEHEVDGLRIPGTRWGIDNPDTIYRVIPISADERYEIRGRVGAHRMTENYFTLWDDSMGTEGLLNGHDLVTGTDGSFVVTVDTDPAGGRPNHVQSTPKAHEFYIRDVMLDWASDDPNWLEIVRLGPTSAPPLTDDQQAERTAEYMRKFADFSHSLSKGMTMGKPNRFHLAHSADHGGALRNQVYVGGHFRLDDDEAFVIDVNDGGARYFTVPISNVWGTTMGIVDRTGSLNKAQSEANADGTWTYVLANSDPGVYNWVDPCGLTEGILTLRMAEFPGQRPTEELAASGQVVKLADLESVLPPGTREITADERAAQIAERAAAYARRLPEVVSS